MKKREFSCLELNRPQPISVEAAREFVEVMLSEGFCCGCGGQEMKVSSVYLAQLRMKRDFGPCEMSLLAGAGDEVMKKALVEYIAAFGTPYARAEADAEVFEVLDALMDDVDVDPPVRRQ